MEKTSDNLLIIFYRNPEKGKVKTRLAATLGDDRALLVYLELARQTRTVTVLLDFDKAVYYSNKIDESDLWTKKDYGKFLQRGSDLGERMRNAFEEGFARGYKSICTIGTDCYELSSSEIREAFQYLKDHDVVIGPAADGGYYLLGMNKLHPQLFEKKQWSTKTVSDDTIKDIEAAGLTFLELITLRDVDTEEDLPEDLQ
jgi:uncharacterized protein